MQLHRLAVYDLHGVHHVLYELCVGGAGGVYAHHHLGFLRLLLVGALGAHEFAVGVDGVLALAVGFGDGCREEFVEAGGEALSAGGVADDECLTVQSAHHLWHVVEVVGAACHQRHQEASSHEYGCRVLAALQPLADVLQYGIILKEGFNLCAPGSKSPLKSRPRPTLRPPL